MKVEQRDFATYGLRDDVRLLAGGVIAEMANYAEIELPDADLVGSLGTLVGVFGKKKVLRDNKPPRDLELNTATEWVERSGVQKRLDRTIASPFPANGTALVVLTGGVANWQDRSARAAMRHFASYNDDLSIIVAAGNRVMDSATEQANPNIRKYLEHQDKYPTEAEYASTFVVPQLQERGYGVGFRAYATQNGKEVARRLVEERFMVEPEELMCVRVANAGLQLACQLAKALHQRYVDNPWMIGENVGKIGVLTDNLPVATDEIQLADAAHYQSPFTALRQLALTAKGLAEVQQLRQS